MMTELQSQLLISELLRANLMFEQWEKNKEEVITKYPTLEFNAAVLLLPSVNFLFVGIAFIYSVLEFMEKKSMPYPESVKKDIKHTYHKLRRFRNAVFHINDKFLDQRQIELMDFPNSLETIVKIHSVLQAYFLELLRNRNA